VSHWLADTQPLGHPALSRRVRDRARLMSLAVCRGFVEAANYGPVGYWPHGYFLRRRLRNEYRREHGR
jgi:hypothetical protein